MSVFVCNGKAKKSKKSLSSDWAENLAESNKGLLLRPAAMAEGVERAAKCRMGPVSFHMTILQPLEDLESRNTETNESVTCRFCQGNVEVVEKLRTWFHLDVPVAEQNLSIALNLFCISHGEKQGVRDKSCIVLDFRAIGGGHGTASKVFSFLGLYT